MKRGKKLVHEKIKKRKYVTCCVYVSLSFSTVIKFAFNLAVVYLIVGGWHHTKFFPRFILHLFVKN